MCNRMLTLNELVKDRYSKQITCISKYYRMPCIIERAFINLKLLILVNVSVVRGPRRKIARFDDLPA